MVLSPLSTTVPPCALGLATADTLNVTPASLAKWMILAAANVAACSWW